MPISPTAARSSWPNYLWMAGGVRFFAFFFVRGVRTFTATATLLPLRARLVMFFCSGWQMPQCWWPGTFVPAFLIP